MPHASVSRAAAAVLYRKAAGEECPPDGRGDKQRQAEQCQRYLGEDQPASYAYLSAAG